MSSGCCAPRADALPPKPTEGTILAAASFAGASVIAGKFYRRPLPDTCVAFASEEGRKLFRLALDAGHLECYYALAAHFSVQADPAFCGLGTLAMVLNALSVDPGRAWKGVTPWRMFSEDQLDCCAPLDVVAKQGISLDTFACLARCNNAHIVVTRPPPPGEAIDASPSASSNSLEAFREAVKACTRTPEGRALVVAYSRKPLKQTGDGHFSPIGAYEPSSDSVLILDTARFKYPPHWVALPLLYEAMRPLDLETGKPRGWAVLTRNHATPLLLFHFGGSVVQSPASSTTRTRLNSTLSALIARVMAALLKCERDGCCRPIEETNNKDEDGTGVSLSLLRTGVGCFVRSYRKTVMQGGDVSCCGSTAGDNSASEKTVSVVSTILDTPGSDDSAALPASSVAVALNNSPSAGPPLAISTDQHDHHHGSASASASKRAIWDKLSSEHRSGVTELLQALERTRMFALVLEQLQLSATTAEADATSGAGDETPLTPYTPLTASSTDSVPEVTLSHIITMLVFAWACTSHSLVSDEGIADTSTKTQSVVATLREEALREVGGDASTEEAVKSDAKKLEGAVLLRNEVRLLSDQLEELVGAAAGSTGRSAS